jgi:hypothetical protein
MEDVTNGLYIEDIDGLGPVKATIASTSFANMDGAQFQSAYREARNLVFKLGLEPDYTTQTVQQLRNLVYRFFRPKTSISLRLFVDDLELDTSGVVETCEPSIFSREPVMDISVICHNPDLIDLEEQTLTGDSVSNSDEELIEYVGTEDTGFIFTMTFDRDESEVTIYQRPPDEVTRRMDLSATFLTGDILTVSTVPGDRYVRVNRGGVVSSFLFAKSAQSPWLVLTEGDNYIRVYATGDPIPYEIKYMTRYGGI